MHIVTNMNPVTGKYETDLNPGIQENKEFSITANGNFEITPSTGNILMEKATVNVNVPSLAKEEQIKTVTYSTDGIYVVSPDSGKALNRVNITVATDSGNQGLNYAHLYIWKVNGTNEYEVFTFDEAPNDIENFNLSAMSNGSNNNFGIRICSSLNVSGYTKNSDTSFTITLGGQSVTYIRVIEENIPSDVLAKFASIKDCQSAIINLSNYSSSNNQVVINPDNASAMASNAITLTGFPIIESNKEITIDVPYYDEPVEITPTTGNDYMEKATVTLVNIPKFYAWRNNNDGHILYTLFHLAERSNGIGYQCGTTKNAALLQKSVLVNNDKLYIDGWPTSLYERYPDGDLDY